MWFRSHRTNGESKRALEDADKHLQEVKKRTPEVHAIAKSLREIREKNHFAEQLQVIFGDLGGGRR